MNKNAVNFLNELQKEFSLKSRRSASGKERTEKWLELLGCDVNAFQSIS